MRIKSSHVISLQASSERVSVNTFVYCSICTCMFAICTYVQTHMSTCGIFIHFVNSLETWANKTSSDHRECILWVKTQNFCFEFQQSETDCKSDFGLQHKWGNLCFMKKPHLKYNSSTHTIFPWVHGHKHVLKGQLRVNSGCSDKVCSTKLLVVKCVYWTQSYTNMNVKVGPLLRLPQAPKCNFQMQIRPL